MLDLGVLLLFIIELVFVCVLLLLKIECVVVSKILLGLVVVLFDGDCVVFVEVVCCVLYLSKVILYV